MLVKVNPEEVWAESKTLGERIYHKIVLNLRDNFIEFQELAICLGLSKAGLSRLLSNLQEGKVSLFNLLLIATALRIELLTLLENNFCEEDDIVARYLKKSTFSSGDFVKLKDILAPIWNTFKDGEKRKLGKQFYQDVKNTDRYPGIKFAYKGSDNQAVYRII